MMSLLISAVRQRRQAGLRVVATVCDLGQTNTELYKGLGVTEERPKFAVDGESAVALYSVPHLMKCVRNFLMKRNVTVDGKTLSWSYI